MFGPDRGLATAYSASRGAAWFGVPPEGSGAVLHVGDPPTALRAAFTSARPVGALDNNQRVADLVQGTPIWLLEGRTAPWSQLWSAIRRL